MFWFALPVLLVVFFLLWASYPWDVSPRTEEGLSGMVATSKDPPENATILTVLSWNIAWGHGQGSEGTADYLPKDAAAHRAALESIAATIRAVRADVVLLQEIDFGASRSHGTDQLRTLAELARLPYWARAESWRPRYVPFPYWPLSRQFGGMSSGGGVLSRWPIEANQVALLEKPAAQPWWYKLFYPHRYFQRVTISAGATRLKFVNLHLEAFDRPNKALQARRLVKLMKESTPDFVGGDFNMLPDGAIKRSGFANPVDVYENDATAGIIAGAGMREAVGAATYLQKEDTWFTFPASRPDRRLDYVYFDPKWTLISAEVVAPADRTVSDHLPFKAVFRFHNPEVILD
jgi:endonuclease/exonuclease/phosphatase family metal-dependent hydrolase